jgi:hypothetical protein
MSDKYLICMAPTGDLELWTYGLALRSNMITGEEFTERTWLIQTQDTDDYHRYLEISDESKLGLPGPEYWGREILQKFSPRGFQ